MAGFWSDSGSEYSLDLTTSDEEQLWAIVDRLSPVSPQSRPAPAIPATSATPARRTNTSALARNPIPSSPFSPELDADATLAIEETIAAIADDDLSFDISELQEDDASPNGQAAAHLHDGAPRSSTPEEQNRRPPPPATRENGYLAPFLARTEPRTMRALLPGPDVDYPDLSGALSVAQEDARKLRETEKEAKESVEAHRSPLLRFRTYPKKPLSVSDLTAGSWCELQHFYTLTRLRGRKTRTEAMKRGTKLHQKLEHEVSTTVKIDTVKREDTFGLKIWNMIHGLRALREEGFTLEFVVWGMVDGNLVCGCIDRLSYDNPDEELEEDVLSSRGSSQSITNSQPYEISMPGDSQIFVTDVKTRNTTNPPPQSQVRVAIIQLFLYHRFMSDMASDRLDYMRVFERFGLNPDEPFSDAFMAQIGEMHEEIFAEADVESASTFDDDNSSTTEPGGFVSAPSSPSQLSFASSAPEPTLKYRTLRTLVTLLKFELRLTFPRGASDLGNIVAVEYRYRGRDKPPNPNPEPATTANPTLPTNLALNPDETDPYQPTTRQPQKEEPEPGSVICTNTFFVEPETLDLFLSETMAWWKGEREPQGVPVEEAGFKCRSCEFVGDCGWRQSMDLEARKKRARGGGGLAGGSVVGSTTGAGVGVGVGDVEDAGAAPRRRRGRPKKAEKEDADVDMDAEREIQIAEGGVATEREAKREAKRGRGRPRKVEQPAVDAEMQEVEAGEGEATKEESGVKRGRGRPKNIILREGPRW